MTAQDNAEWPGKLYGATAQGPGSVAGMGRRMVAFLIDIALCAMLALSFTWPDPPQNWSLLIWASVTILSVGLFGMTPGQWMVGIRVASVRGALFVGLWAIPRTVLIFLVIPVLVVNADGRGLHDRATRTIVLNTR